MPLIEVGTPLGHDHVLRLVAREVHPRERLGDARRLLLAREHFGHRGEQPCLHRKFVHAHRAAPRTQRHRSKRATPIWHVEQLLAIDCEAHASARPRHDQFEDAPILDGRRLAAQVRLRQNAAARKDLAVGALKAVELVAELQDGRAVREAVDRHLDAHLHVRPLRHAGGVVERLVVGQHDASVADLHLRAFRADEPHGLAARHHRALCAQECRACRDRHHDPKQSFHRFMSFAFGYVGRSIPKRAEELVREIAFAILRTSLIPSDSRLSRQADELATQGWRQTPG